MDADVLVVGAGCAGLAAAALIYEAGRQVRVLEARERLGGRVFTLRDPRAPVTVELGAEFVHGAAPLSRALLAEAGARTVPMSGEAWREGADARSVGEAWSAIGRVLEALRADQTPDRSFADFLRAEGVRFGAEAVAAARAFVEGFHAADPERISERSLAEEGTGGAGDSDRVPAGYDTLVHHLAARLPPEAIVRERIVRRVTWRDGHVEVSAARPGGEADALSASAVLVTVPLGVLKAPSSAAGIAFEPEIPGLHAMLAGLEAGSAVRVTLAFGRPLWGMRGLVPSPDGAGELPSFIQTPLRAFNAYWAVEPPTAAALVAWSGGARSRGLAGDAEELAEHALRGLSDAFGADDRAMSEALTGAWSHDWRSDPFSLGAYTYVAVGGSDAPDQLARPVRDTVFFAGEATCGESIGTVEGALQSAGRAARNVLRALT